ncbi:MAG: TIGR04255 family protein [Bacteroidetes bacterium]|nr:TIGR04255 family protein [Bacteroidota bacterium]
MNHFVSSRRFTLMAQKYSNPPLVESLVEFRFGLEDPNDPTLPGLLYSEIKEQFPNRANRNIAFPSPNGDGKEIELKLTPLAQFRNTDDSMLVQVGGNLLTINCINKYVGWDLFSSTIKNTYKQYCQLAAPSKVIRIGFRCINKFDFPKSEVNLNDYFEFLPTRPSILTSPYNHFGIHIECPENDNRDLLIMKNNSVVSNIPDNIGVMLDMEYATQNGIVLDTNEEVIIDWIENAHTKLKDAFESSITNILRKTFD